MHLFQTESVITKKGKQVTSNKQYKKKITVGVHSEDKQKICATEKKFISTVALIIKNIRYYNDVV